MAEICSIQEIALDWGVRALRIENDLLAATVLIDKGADIYELIYKPQGMDVLWKSPWGLKPQGRGFENVYETTAGWLEAYAGGWQVLFPNGGNACTYKGAALNFHGEASMIAWRWQVIEQGAQAAEVYLSARLFRSPFRIERWMRVEAGKPDLIIRERVTNEAGEPMDYMWSHHPAYGAPFLSDQCRIDTGATQFWADPTTIGTANPLKPDQRYLWPTFTNGVDMTRVPGEDTPRDTLAYLTDFKAGWYGITNTALGFGVGLVWDKSVFPYAWYWQEMHGSPGFPWYKAVYVMAIEPASTVPGQGLVNAMDKTGSHRTLAAGEAHETTFRAVFYESATGIDGIAPDGRVTVKK